MTIIGSSFVVCARLFVTEMYFLARNQESFDACAGYAGNTMDDSGIFLNAEDAEGRKIRNVGTPTNNSGLAQRARRTQRKPVLRPNSFSKWQGDHGKGAGIAATCNP